MDFINGCTTNVHVVDNFHATLFTHHKYTGPHNDGDQGRKTAQRAVIRLRRSNVLCTLVDDNIWLFGQSEHGLDEDYSVVRTGIVEGQKDVIRLLLNAIESVLTHALAELDDITHIAPWTWLYRNRVADSETTGSIITLRVDDASGGALYLLSDTKPTNWVPIDFASDHVKDEILLAPYGRSAKLVDSNAKTDAATAQWKMHVSEALQLEGIYLDQDAAWTDLEINEDGLNSQFAWPSQLCVVQDDTETPSRFALTDATNWQIWTDNSPDVAYRNPLAEAEEWFTGAAERKHRAAEEATKAEARTDLNAPAGTMTASSSNAMTSPPFMQRIADQQAAMAGIYPTPPDGLAHQGQTQLGPQMGMSAATPSVAQPSDPAQTDDILNDTQKRNRDSLDLDTYPMDEGEEDLFGDVGGGMFEENEIGDADFDYFDEPDDAPAGGVTVEQTDKTMADEPMQDERDDATAGNPTNASEKGELDQTREPESVVEPASSPTSIPRPVDAPADQQGTQPPPITATRALSPFGIRERLLPPPVPASFAQSSGDTRRIRRSSSFAPIVFRDGVGLGAKYASMELSPVLQEKSSTSGPSIALPVSRSNNDSDDDSDDSGSTDGGYNDVELPPKLPWESTKKRKRGWEMSDAGSVELGAVWTEDNESAFEVVNDNEQQRDLRKTLLERLLHPPSHAELDNLAKKPPFAISVIKEDDERDVPYMKDLCDLEKEDLVYIAQLVSEQASTCLTSQPSFDTHPSTRNTFPITQLTKALTSLLPSPPSPCDLSRLAITRDPAPPPRTTPRAPVPPRPGPEVPDIFFLPAPFIRIQRNNDDWEMLPPALSFWEPNGLAAASGPKNVRARAVLPCNKDLRLATRSFMGALGRAYEGCKLGSHSYDVSEDGESDAGARVEENANCDDKEAFLEEYMRTCVKLGEDMAVTSCMESGAGWNGTYVVYILDPFSGGGWPGGRKYLCACFWMLFQSYLEGLKAGKKGKGEDNMVPDVVLQILPIEMVAVVDRLVIPDPNMLANLAREVYDRCPDASLTLDGEGDGAAAPSILLAPPVPKRIAFQLAADVSAESLLQDGRVLHLAVAMSEDREWMVCVWSDGQGRILMHESFCMRGLTVAAVIRQVWQRTGEIVGSRRVVWRVFLALEEGAWKGCGLERVWRNVVTTGRIGGTTICVTLVKVHGEVGVQILWDGGNGDGVGGLVTPASTPVAFPSYGGNGVAGGGGGIATGTNSPNVGASDGFGAPLTPAGSESTISGAAAAMQVVESDPDAHLVDVEDESCGVLLKPQLSTLSGLDGMANGAIVRKGREGERERGLLGVSLCWTLQVKAASAQGASAAGGGVEMGSLRQAEITLREVLRMYRALGVLTRARGLFEGEGGVLPVHLAIARGGARGLEGFFS